MPPQPGISTTSAPPNTVVAVQPGMNVQPVVLVDQNGQYVTASTANALATTTAPVNVGNATAPTAGQVLTATSGTAATWQAGGGLPLTTLGDTVYENATPAWARLAGNTTATKNFLTQTGTGAVSAAPAWGVIASADMPTGTTSAKGALQLDGTAGDIQPVGASAAAGSVGKPADAGHVHATPLTTAGDLLFENATPAPARLAVGSAGQLLSPVAGMPAWANPQSFLSLYQAPSGATAETFPAGLASAVSAAGTSGTLYVRAIGMPAGVAVNNITFVVGTTAATLVDVTHGWYVLLDSNLVVRAVSADQTSGNWGTINTPVTLSVAGSAYTTTYAGLYYVGQMVAISAASMPLFVSAPAIALGVRFITPLLMASSSTGQTTPPTTGTTMGALTGGTSVNYYAYTS